MAAQGTSAGGGAGGGEGGQKPVYNPHEGLKLEQMIVKKLGPGYVSHRAGAGGGRVPYIEAHRLISLANEMFGFNGWSNEVRSQEIDFCDQDPETKRYSVAVTAVIRLSFPKFGRVAEDLGVGKMENCKSKADAIEKAKKEAVTDGIKRAFRLCGDLFGNCLYDKSYNEYIASMKAPKPRIEPAMLVHPEQVRGDAVGWPSEMGYQQPAPVAAPSYGMPAPPLAAPAPPQPPQHHAHPPPAPRVPAQRAITAPPAQNAPAPQPQRAPPQPQRAAPAAQPNRPPARAPQQQQQAPPPRKMPVPRAHTVAHAPQVASAAAAIASTSAAASKATNAQALHTAGVEAAELAAIPWSDDIDDGPYEDPLLGVYEDDISLALHDDSGFAEAVELAEAQEAKRHERQEAMRSSDTAKSEDMRRSTTAPQMNPLATKGSSAVSLVGNVSPVKPTRVSPSGPRPPPKPMMRPPVPPQQAQRPAVNAQRPSFPADSKQAQPVRRSFTDVNGQQGTSPNKRFRQT